VTDFSESWVLSGDRNLGSAFSSDCIRALPRWKLGSFDAAGSSRALE
jgi:hypothetical protein